MAKSKKIVDRMYEFDYFSQWLGIEKVMVDKGHVILKMKVTKDMLNGFGIAHGGITYSLADSALAFASNGRGVQSVSIETSINHIKPTREGDTLIADAKELNVTNKTGLYEVKVKNQDGELVALFKGMVYRTGKEWKL
ncbi:MAG: hydroxyphenylacetyl-CoA thioesterase PaaI [Crocinitomicaceae bacterium]|nr:hydroxyphenylacetyl-CoA thioesterase PaaI [Crocinitomicaceae bacterium]